MRRNLFLCFVLVAFNARANKACPFYFFYFKTKGLYHRGTNQEKLRYHLPVEDDGWEKIMNHASSFAKKFGGDGAMLLPVGAGFNGFVFRVIDGAGSRSVIIKTTEKATVSISDSARLSLLRNLVGNSVNAHIVEEVGKTRNFLVLEDLEGVTLRDYLKNPNVSEVSKAQILRNFENFKNETRARIIQWAKENHYTGEISDSEAPGFSCFLKRAKSKTIKIKLHKGNFIVTTNGRLALIDPY